MKKSKKSEKLLLIDILENYLTTTLTFTNLIDYISKK
ncbi:MAG: hypothetical protein K940chlam4_01260, partial [Candidatus Anoxychlamydiales bacterium]|nr:hypothetical protein [Candidatus Anoxychlamydiales bacterium]